MAATGVAGASTQESPPQKEGGSRLVSTALTCLAAAWLYHQLQTGGSTDLHARRAETSTAETIPEWTLEGLKKHNGQSGDPLVLIGFLGRVFNVTERGEEFYGMGQNYEVFAGYDCTRNFALTSTKKKFRNNNLEGLQKKHLMALNITYWDVYMKKYPIVGKVTDPPYNPSDWDEYAGPFADLKLTDRGGIPIEPMPKGKRVSKCPMRAAAQVAVDFVKSWTGLQLAAPSWFDAPAPAEVVKEEKPEPATAPEVQPETVEELDKNGDGEVSFEELGAEAGEVELYTRMFALADASKNGKLDAGELAALHRLLDEEEAKA